MSLWETILTILRGERPLRWNPETDPTVRYLREQTRAAEVATAHLRRTADDPYPIAEMIRRGSQDRSRGY
jgi:hypothetical protein